MHKKSHRIFLFQHIYSTPYNHIASMQVWEPVLQDEYASHARQVIQAIEKKIIHQFEDNQHLGVHQGMAGQLIFLSEYGCSDSGLQGYIVILSSRIANTKDINGAFFHGLSGICLALLILKEQFPI